MARENRNRDDNFTFTLTRHARTRCQQRGISPERIGIVARFGKRIWRKGSYRCYMTSRGRRRAARELGGRYARLADKLDFYVTLCPITYAVITVAYSDRRQKL